MSRFRLIIDSSLSQLFVVSAVIRGVCDELQTDTAQCYPIEVCVLEAVTNVIKHGYLGVSGHNVTIEVSYSKDRLDIRIMDTGRSMPEEQIMRLSQGSHVFEFDPECLESVPGGGTGSGDYSRADGSGLLLQRGRQKLPAPDEIPGCARG